MTSFLENMENSARPVLPRSGELCAGCSATRDRFSRATFRQRTLTLNDEIIERVVDRFPSLKVIFSGS